MSYDITKEGYAQVFLNHGQRDKERRLVHRIVAEAFIENPFDLPIVHHKDHNRLNNTVDNLEWSTYRDNNLNSDCYQKAAEATSKTVYQYDVDWNLVATYSSAREACRETGYTLAVIARACNDLDTVRYGYHWSYVPHMLDATPSDITYTNGIEIDEQGGAVDKIELYTTEDIQQIFKCGKRWAYELMRAPAFPSVKIGGKYIVERSALEAWFKTYAGKEFIM